MSAGVTEHPVNIEPPASLWQVLWDELKPFPGRDRPAIKHLQIAIPGRVAFPCSVHG
jgi:hypothetical protein